MRIHSPAALAVTAAALSLAMSAVTAAQDSPPGRTAQLSYIEGSVSLEPAGTQNWTAADLNRPVTVGDKLWADRDSRAELDIGDAVVRLGSFTGLSFLNLDQLTAQMQVTAGTVIVHVRGLADDEQDEIDTPNLALSLDQPGTYRVQVSESGDTTIVKVISGEAVASGGGETFTVRAQQSVTFTGTSTLSADYAMLGAPDALDDWSMARDRQEAAAAATVDQYVSPAVVGAEDLAAYGNWQYTQWGYAWFPVVPVGWAPYSLGQWMWIFPWGWTWVDEEPWGFAPFHYGRWGWWNGGWCWVPGPRVVRPIYAPALVAFTRSRIGVSAGARPTVGWLPLGPRDVYIPGYAASRAYVRNINVTNTTIINNTVIDNVYRGRVTQVTYANSSVPGAITAVPRSVFTTAQPVAPHRVALPRHGVTRAGFTSAVPAVTPVRASVLGPGSGHAFSPPRRLIDRPVVARIAPAQAPVPFGAQQSAIRANGGRPLTLDQWAHLRPNRPAVRARLAEAGMRETPGTAGGVAPALRRQPTAERPSVPRNRLPWLQEPSSKSAGAVPAPRPQPAFERPSVPSNRPPGTRSEPSRPPRAQEPAQPAHQPHFENAPRYSSPPRSESPPPRYESAPPRYESAPPRYESAPPRYESAPPRAAPGYRPSHPPAERGAPAREDRRPPRVQAASGNSDAEVGGWASPPMYRAQQSPDEESAAADATPAAAGNTYAPPATPPPMYRPVGGGAFAGDAPRETFAPRSAPPPPEPAAHPAPTVPDARFQPAHPGRPFAAGTAHPPHRTVFRR